MGVFKWPSSGELDLHKTSLEDFSRNIERLDIVFAIVAQAA